MPALSARTFKTTLLAAAVALNAPAAHADAGDAVEIVTIAWEAYWNQSGFPKSVMKWQGPIRVKFTGDDANRHRDFSLQQLRTVADIAGIPVIEVGADDKSANFEVEFLNNQNLMQPTEPCRTNYRSRNGVIYGGRIRANDARVWYCMLHEAMHAMGFDGHPHANSVLTYFARSHTTLTIPDQHMLKALYSNDVKPGMSPLLMVRTVARNVIDTIPAGAERTAAEQAIQAFYVDIFRQMEQYADGGEPLAILLRSGKTTSAGIANGRIEIQYYLGLAYTFGHLAAVDQQKGTARLVKAAQADRMNAQFYAGEAYLNGRGVPADPVEAYKWYALASARGQAIAGKALEALDAKLAPEQIAEGRARADEFRQKLSAGSAK